MALTKGTWAINTIQSLATRTKNQATAVKQAFDKAASDIKTYINNTLTVEIDTLDAANVKKTGNQSIDGVKTFTSSPIVPVATGNTEAVQKVYVDDKDTAQTGALNTHKTSSDHDGRYYTETELDNGQLDNRYYTETELSKITATSGAELIGSKTVSGVTGNTVWAQISNLYSQLVSVVLGQIIDRSLTYIKIALGTITNAEIANNTILESNMAAAMKKQAGGVAEYDTVATHLADIVTDSNPPHGLAMNKLNATVAPTVNDDSGDGYGINSVWVDVTADKAYICLDSTIGAAVWKEISSTFIGCRVYRTSSQSINSGTVTAIAWDNESFDTSNMHDNVTNNTRITIPKTGKYLVSSNVNWAANGTGSRLLYATKNGSLALADLLPFDVKQAVTTDSERTSNMISAVVSLAANDYIEIMSKQYSGGALNVDTGSTYPKFEVIYLGV